MSLQRQLDIALPGAEVAYQAPLHGGDLSEVLKARLADGREVVLKRGPRVQAEARMLRALAAAGADTPQVLGDAPELMVLEWLPPAPADASAWERCGASLRRVHECHGTQYGWPEDYAFGAVEIPNAALPDWPTFWAERRLRPSLPHVPRAMATRLERLARRLPDLLPDRRPRPCCMATYGPATSSSAAAPAR